MKKRIFAKITAFLLLMTMLFSINVFADGYSYGYYVDNVEYIGDGKIEATIVFASNTYGSDVDVKGVGVLAVYDETQTQILGLSSIQYNEASPFLSNQRFSVTQTVSLTDLTLERYVVKFILLESMEDMKPAAYVSTGTNCWVLEGDEISDVPADNPPSGGGSGGSSGGYLPDEDSTDLVIAPELFVDFAYNGYTCEPNIRYYKDADAETPNAASMVEAPFKAYINKGLIYKSGNGDNESDVALTLNYIIGSSAVNKVTTNNRAYRFKDTDNNGKYDTLIIENSASFVVGKIIANDYQIYRDNSASIFNSSLLFDGNTRYNFAPLDLDTTSGMVSYTIKDTEGNALSFGDIKVGDVLDVAMSVDGNKYHYDIVVSTAKAVTGTIMRCSTKKIKGGATIDCYEINGKAYRINGAASASKLEPGVSGTFYLTNDNAIISCDITKNYSYGIVIATGAKTGTFSNGVQAQIMAMDGEVKVFDYAETVSVFTTYERVITSTVDADPSRAGFQASSELLIAAGTIVIYETNSAGEIRRIYTTQAAIEEKENGDVRLGALSYSSYNADAGKLNGKYITDETVIIGVPSAASVGNKDKYFLSSKKSLVDEECYEGYIVYNTEKEVKLAFITNLIPTEVENTFSYGIVISTEVNATADSNSVKATIMTAEDGVQDFDFADTVLFNYTDIDETSVDIASGTVIIYQKNFDGEIRNIYTTSSAIEAKEHGEFEVETFSSSAYSGGLIFGNYITDATKLITVPSITEISNTDMYSYTLASSLINGEIYSGTIVTDVDTGEVKFAFITDFIPADFEKNCDYAVVIAVGAYTSSFKNGVQTQIMTESGEIKVFDFAEYVEFNASGLDVASNVDADGATAGFQPNATFNIPAGTVVGYEVNSDNEIVKIYTTHAAIEDKENNDVKLATLYSAPYDAYSGKLYGKYITDKTVIIGVPTVAYAGNKDEYFVASKKALMDGECYSGTIVVNSTNGEVLFAFITNLLIRPSYTTSPMIVTEKATVWLEEEIRQEFTGLIDGQEVRYVLENRDDLTIIGMTGEVVTSYPLSKVAAFDIGVNDVIQVVTNDNNEIVAYRHIMKYDYNEGYIAMVATSGNEDSDYVQTVVLTKLSDGTVSTHNAAVANKQMYGYAAAGRVNKVTSRGIELFIDPTINTSVAMLTSPTNILDAAYDPNTPVYVYGRSYSKVRTTVFESIKTFDVVCSGLDYNVAMDMAKADDVVYIYSFDGENVLNFIVDVNSDNR